MTAWAVRLDWHKPISVSPADILSLAHRLQVLRVATLLVVTQVIQDRFTRIANEEHVCGSMSILRVSKSGA